jgi:DNA-binding NtrC family response regulator
LSQRIEDIPDMIRYFLRRHGPEVGVAAPSITPEAIAFLQSQTWPGNVRELENAVRKALLFARDYTIGVDQVKEIVTKTRQTVIASQQTHADYISDLMDQVERGDLQNAFGKMLVDLEPELYSQAIRRTHGNLTKAAQWLGVTRLKMREKLNEFGLHPNQETDGE